MPQPRRFRRFARIAAVAAITFALAAAACSEDRFEYLLAQQSIPTSIDVTSSTLKEGVAIPLNYTCFGDNLSPQLTWTGVPDGTKSLALVTSNPDNSKGTWAHWVYYAIPPNVTELAKGVPTAKELPDGARQGLNDFEEIGYKGPCLSAKGTTHRYFFTVYAVDVEIDLASGATKNELLEAIDGHILAEGGLMATYGFR